MNTLRANFLPLLILPLFFPAQTFAADATMAVAPSVGTYKVYDDVTMRVEVSSDGQFVSAVEGRLSYNPKELTVTHINKVGALVSSWTQEPFVDDELGEIIFGGAFATGTLLNNTAIITMRVRPERVGETRIRFEGGAAVISADGLGSNILTSFKSGKYRIQPEELADDTTPISPTPIETAQGKSSGEVLGATAAPELLTPIDRTPPINFFLSEVPGREESDPDIVVDVTATDTLSGVAYYTFAVDGGDAVRWEDRGSHHFVYRAITAGVHTLTGVVYDRAGNTTTAKLISTVAEQKLLASTENGDGGDENVTRMLATPVDTSIFSRHPFLPVMVALLLLVSFFALGMFRRIPVYVDENDEVLEAEVPSDIYPQSGQIVLAPRTKKNKE